MGKRLLGGDTATVETYLADFPKSYSYEMFFFLKTSNVSSLTRLKT